MVPGTATVGCSSSTLTSTLARGSSKGGLRGCGTSSLSFFQSYQSKVAEPVGNADASRRVFIHRWNYLLAARGGLKQS